MRSEETSLIESLGFSTYEVYLFRPDGDVSMSEVVSALHHRRVIAGVLDAQRIASILVSFLVDEDDLVVCEDTAGNPTKGPELDDFLSELARSTTMWIDLGYDEVITAEGETDYVDEPARLSTAREVTIIATAAPDVAITLGGSVPGTSWYTVNDDTTVLVSPVGMSAHAFGDLFTDEQLPVIKLIRAGEVWRAEWCLTTDGISTFGVAVGPDLEPVTTVMGHTQASQLAAELCMFGTVVEEKPSGKFQRILLEHPIHQLLDRSDELATLPGDLFLREVLSALSLPAGITRVILDHLNTTQGIDLQLHGASYGLLPLTELPEDPDSLRAIATRSRVLYDQSMGRKPTMRSLIFGTSMGVILRSAAAVLGAIALAFVAWFMWEDPESTWFERYGSIGFALYVLWVAVKTPRELPHLRRAEAFVPKGDSPFL